jgi:hypothetical protein
MDGVDAHAERTFGERPRGSLQHPAVGAALAARNAVAAEMAIAARQTHDPADACWDVASDMVTGADAGARELALSVNPSAAAAGAPSGARRRRAGTPWGPSSSGRPRARRRRELLEMGFWFVVGGLGGLATLAAVRFFESL